jgi:hypothetical protein
MKSILRILADLALLPVRGCAFPGNRDYSDDCPRTPVTSNQKTAKAGTKVSKREKRSGAGASSIIPKPAVPLAHL